MSLSTFTDTPIRPRPLGTPVPLTACQLREWKRLSKQGKPMSVRVCAASVRVLGGLNTGWLEKCIETVAKRHESLRTRFMTIDCIPRQQIDPTQEHQLRVVDLSGVSSVNLVTEAALLAQTFVDDQIDLTVGPLFEARLYILSNCDHVLVLLLDHLVSDAVSWAILYREIWTLYNQTAQGLALSLPNLTVQFADYAVWQQRTYDTWLDKHEAYWRRRLAGAPRIQLVRDHALMEVRDPIYATAFFPIGKAVTAGLRDLARRERTLLPIVALTLYAAMMSNWCDQEDLVMLFVSHGRRGRPELEHTIGFIANFLYLRIQILKTDSFIDLLKRVSLELYSAHQHQDFDRVPDLIPECTTELLFNWLPNNWPRPPADRLARAVHTLEIKPFPLRSSAMADSIQPMFCDTASGIGVTVAYPTHAFAISTIQRFGKELRCFASEFSQRPHAPIASVALPS